jgi:hypothetical protein
MNVLFVQNLDPTIFYAWYTYCIYVKPIIIVIYFLLNLIIKIDLNNLGIFKRMPHFCNIYIRQGNIIHQSQKGKQFLRSVGVN